MTRSRRVGFRLEVVLCRIDSLSARVGDEIEADAASEVKRKKETVVPAGATVIGRLAAVWDASGIVQDHVPRSCRVDTLLVGMAVAFQGYASFFRMSEPETASVTETVSMLDFPGVALLTVEGNPFDVSTGLVMDWVTKRP